MDCSGDEEEEQFFESLEEMLSPSDSGSEAADNETGCRNADVRSKYEIWKRAPSSIQERRQRFLVRMGLANPSELGNQVNSTSAESTCSTETANIPNGIERLRENSGAVLRTAGSSGRKTHSKNLINIGLREVQVEYIEILSWPRLYIKLCQPHEYLINIMESSLLFLPLTNFS